MLPSPAAVRGTAVAETVHWFGGTPRSASSASSSTTTWRRRRCYGGHYLYVRWLAARSRFAFKSITRRRTGDGDNLRYARSATIIPSTIEQRGQRTRCASQRDAVGHRSLSKRNIRRRRGEVNAQRFFRRAAACRVWFLECVRTAAQADVGGSMPRLLPLQATAYDGLQPCVRTEGDAACSTDVPRQALRFHGALPVHRNGAGRRYKALYYNGLRWDCHFYFCVIG